MPFKVAEIVLQGHLAWPAAAGESRRCADVVNTACPGGIVRLVVLRTERDQLELLSYESIRYREVRWNEQLTAHPAMLSPRLR